MSPFRHDSYSLLNSCPQCTLAALNTDRSPRLQKAYFYVCHICMIHRFFLNTVYSLQAAILQSIECLHCFLARKPWPDLLMEGLRTVHVSNTLSKLLLDTLKPAIKNSGLIHLLHTGGVMESHGYCHGHRAAHTAVCLRKYSCYRAIFRLSFVSDQIIFLCPYKWTNLHGLLW